MCNNPFTTQHDDLRGFLYLVCQAAPGSIARVRLSDMSLGGLLPFSQGEVATVHRLESCKVVHLL